MIRAFVSYVTWPRALRYEQLTLISSLAGGLAGRAKADGGAGGGMTRPAKAANGWLTWMLAGGHQGSANPYRSLRHAYLQSLEQ